MEVHHHSHTSRKKWTHYLWEFIMLFLAVFCGFLAEYQLEHKIEKEKARQYLRSYRDELLLQKTVFAEYKRRYQEKIINSDSVKDIIFNHEENEKLETIKRLIVRVITLIDVPFNTSSYDQMINSGALRYINNIRLQDSMSAYRGMIENTKAYNTRILQAMVNTTFEI